MPNKLSYFLVRFVDLKSGEFHEKEMSEIKLEALELSTTFDNRFQVLSKKYLRTERLGKKYTF